MDKVCMILFQLSCSFLMPVKINNIRQYVRIFFLGCEVGKLENKMKISSKNKSRIAY